MRWVLIIIILIVVALVAFIRFAPADLGKFHVSAALVAPGDDARAGGFTAVRAITTTPERIMAVLHDFATATPRTKVVAGSVADAFVTYETRSKLMGFPDYTTVEIIKGPDGEEDLIAINARLRFGKSDMGVNQARVQRWLDELGLLTVAP